MMADERSRRPFLLAYLVVLLLVVLAGQAEAGNSQKPKKDFSRKSIVFDIKTPKVFYCQQEKQSDLSKTIVKARPLEKLCEYEGQSKPRGAPTDCYNDVDETEFACDEKKRFLLRLKSLDEGKPLSQEEELDYMISKGSIKDTSERIKH